MAGYNQFFLMVCCLSVALSNPVPSPQSSSTTGSTSSANSTQDKKAAPSDNNSRRFLGGYYGGYPYPNNPYPSNPYYAPQPYQNQMYPYGGIYGMPQVPYQSYGYGSYPYGFRRSESGDKQAAGAVTAENRRDVTPASFFDGQFAAGAWPGMASEEKRSNTNWS